MITPIPMQLVNLFAPMLTEESVLQDFSDALILHIYKHKRGKSCRDNTAEHLSCE